MLCDGNGASFWKGIQAHLPAFALFRADRSSTDQDPEAQDPLNAAIKEAIRLQETELNKVQVFVEQEVKKIAALTVSKLQEMDPRLANTLNPQLTIKPWQSLFKVSITGDANIPINKRGSGVRRLILLGFFRAKAELQRTQNNKQSIIYGIEEPETSQHPRNPRLLMSVLQELSATEQVVITTHTPMLARVLPDTALRFINIKPDESREILTSGSEAINAAIAESLGVLPDHNIKMFIGVEGKDEFHSFATSLTSLSRVGRSFRI
jgi:putative ATP-dependent endonuclease of OLD family